MAASGPSRDHVMIVNHGESFTHHWLIRGGAARWSNMRRATRFVGQGPEFLHDGRTR
jgi:hypothetical protein